MKKKMGDFKFRLTQILFICQWITCLKDKFLAVLYLTLHSLVSAAFSLFWDYTYIGKQNNQYAYDPYSE